ncbi:MAG: APA family basic amino acid/polyamine antiporter [Verrucomicrobiales bacterium]|jgi:APA family basic amino acid/polyamine antiporter
MAEFDSHSQLRRSLSLGHVFSLSTGAMISSGLFLLPGLAATKGGPSIILAYLIAGILAIPAMLSVAELSTAMPRSGGAYYFLERALGPAVGTVAGFGTWLSLVLKDAFALVGMSAYLNLVFDVPAKPLAVGLIVAFTLLNLFGSKTSAGVQIVLVGFVLVVMTVFILIGLPEISRGDGELSPFFESGASGMAAVVGLIFVSYGGLTKVASVAEEIEDPSRNIPLGMMLSLGVSTLIYTLAVLVTVAVVPPAKLHDDLAPIHSAAEAILPSVGVTLVVIAALAAFSSAVNAGILAAARYPLAMSRDGLLPPVFEKLSSRKTPVAGILVTGAGMAMVVVAFDVGAIAKLASAFVLLTLGLVNLAVIVLRASNIVSYAPGFRAPFFPFLQLAGIALAIYLIIQLGALALILVSVSILISLLWYRLYGRSRSSRTGAIFHVFERLGKLADHRLDREISAAMQSHGVRADDEYAGLIARASVISVSGTADIDVAAHRASEVLGRRINVDADAVTDNFLATGSLWIQPSDRHPTATPVAFFDIDDEHLVIVRAASGIQIPANWGGRDERVNALFFLAGREEIPGRALRLAGELAAYLHTDSGESMIDASFESEVKAALLPGLSIEQYPLLEELPTGGLIGRRIGDLSPPTGVDLEAIRRDGIVLRTHVDLILEADDQLTVIGPRDSLPTLFDLTELLT